VTSSGEAVSSINGVKRMGMLTTHYGRQGVCRRPPAVGTGYTDGDRRRLLVGQDLVGHCPITVGTDWPSAQTAVPTVLSSA
jgi:hypothetical protein